MAVTVWALALLYWFHRVGITFDRNTLLIYVCAGLLAASIGRRGVLSVVRDWLPFGAVLVVYDLSRGAAERWAGPPSGTCSWTSTAGCSAGRNRRSGCSRG